MEQQTLNYTHALKEVMDKRQKELSYLQRAFDDSIELIGNPGRVNDIIRDSLRPALVLANPVQMPLLPPARRNNFPSGLTFRFPEGEGQSRLFTPHELEMCFLLGARGYEDHMAFAEAYGVNEDIARHIFSETHISKESFMRMSILFPKLTEAIIANCSDENAECNFEISIAYLLMSHLVDVNDRNVIKKDGTVDTWYLCR